MDIKYHNINGKILAYSAYSRAKGKRYLLKNGYTVCNNPNYYKGNDGKLWHYNSVMKAWIFEQVDKE